MQQTHKNEHSQQTILSIKKYLKISKCNFKLYSPFYWTHQSIINEPVFVNRIGVSAISSDVMMQWWAEMISKEPHHLDVAGKGYQVPSMWTKLQVGHRSDTKRGVWVDIR